MVIGVLAVVPRAFGISLAGEAGFGEPVPNPLHPRIVVVVGLGLCPDDLAVHDRKARAPSLLVACSHVALEDELLGEVEPAPGRMARRKPSRTPGHSSGAMNSIASTHMTPYRTHPGSWARVEVSWHGRMIDIS